MKSDTKEKLISDYGKLSSYSSEPTKKLLSRVSVYLEINTEDNQLELMRLALLLNLHDIKTHNIPECRRLAAPILELLENTSPWGMFEISILCVAISYTSHTKAIELAEQAVKILDENFSEEKLSKAYKRVIYANLTYAISNAYCYDLNHKNQGEVFDFKGVFFNYYNIAKFLWSGKKFEAQRIILDIRANLINSQLESVDANLKKLREMKEEGWLRFVYDEVTSFWGHLVGQVSDLLFSQIVGHQIQRRREEMGLSVDELAILVAPFVTTEQIVAYESGKHDIPATHIFRFTRAMHIEANYFFGSAPGGLYKPSDPLPNNPELYTIFSRIVNDIDKTQGHIYEILKAVLKLNSFISIY